MSTFIEYTVEQGATFKVQLTINDDNLVGINLAPYVITGEVRKAYTSANITANITCSLVDGSNGVLQLAMSRANTANIPSGRYVYDITAINQGTDEEIRLIEGMMIVTPGVTR